MSDDIEDNGTAVETPAKSKRAPAERTTVTMNDGSAVEFVGRTLVNKDYKVCAESVEVRLDFRNGEVRKLTLDMADPIILQFAGHGAIQKLGDATAGVKDAAGNPDVDSMVLAVDEILDRVNNMGASINDRWYAERKAGDGFSGASVVILAVMEATGKSQEAVKEFLAKKLAANADLTRQDLYKSFRKPGTKTAAIIERLEREKLTASAKMDGDALLAELNG